jgi:exosortase
VLFFCGARLFRSLGLPLALLFFMIPIPGIIYKQVTFPLQLVASRLAEIILELMGVIVLREGNILELSGRLLSVAEACSGIRALLSLSFFSLTYAYLVSERVWMRWALLAAAVPVAVMANASRVVITALLARSHPELAEGFFHTFSGWVIFVVAIAMLIATERVLRRWA